jgi:hypothetical protein
MASTPSASMPVSSRSTGSSPASVSSAAGARSHCPRHGLRTHVAPACSSPSGPSAAISASDPAQRHATSSQTCTTRGGRSSTENSA